MKPSGKQRPSTLAGLYLFLSGIALDSDLVDSGCWLTDLPENSSVGMTTPGIASNALKYQRNSVSKTFRLLTPQLNRRRLYLCPSRPSTR